MTTTHSRPTTGGGTSPEHPNARLMRDFFDAFGAADRDRLAALMADDLIWHLPGSSPISDRRLLPRRLRPALVGERPDPRNTMTTTARTACVSPGSSAASPHCRHRRPMA